MDEKLKDLVFSKDAIEFVTVAVQYCTFLENLAEENSENLTDKLTKLLPLLYLKASLLPEMEMLEDSDPEIAVTEDLYNFILFQVQEMYGKDDSYLEVFMQDMKYSETPILANISEDLTDIYQDLKNCVTVYERGVVEYMNDALCICFENFKVYWGQKLVNVLRALHSLKYSVEPDFLEPDNDYNPEDK